MSPHVFEPSGTQFHYKMPINAVTSIMNRVTGTMLTVGTCSWLQLALHFHGYTAQCIYVFCNLCFSQTQPFNRSRMAWLQASQGQG